MLYRIDNGVRLAAPKQAVTHRPASTRNVAAARARRGVRGARLRAATGPHAGPRAPCTSRATCRGVSTSRLLGPSRRTAHRLLLRPRDRPGLAHASDQDRQDTRRRCPKALASPPSSLSPSLFLHPVRSIPSTGPPSTELRRLGWTALLCSGTTLPARDRRPVVAGRSGGSEW